jgi:hypothetical protein
MKIEDMDFSKVELRVMSEESRAMAGRAQAAGVDDLHRMRAAELYDIKPEDVTEQQRRVGKIMNTLRMYHEPPLWVKETAAYYASYCPLELAEFHEAVDQVRDTKQEVERVLFGQRTRFTVGRYDLPGPIKIEIKPDTWVTTTKVRARQQIIEAATDRFNKAMKEPK